MDVIKMYEYKNVITWELPEPIESKKTVELITNEEQTIFNEFMFTCGTVLSAIVVLM